MKSRILQRLNLGPAIAPQAILSAGAITPIVIDRVAPVPTQPTGITAYTAVNDGSGIYNTACFGVATGTSTGAPTTQGVTFKVQHGTKSDGTDMADVPATAYVDNSGSSATIPSITADNTDVQIYVSCEGLNRYIQLVPTLAFTGGTSPKQFVQAYVALGDCNEAPAS